MVWADSGVQFPEQRTHQAGLVKHTGYPHLCGCPVEMGLALGPGPRSAAVNHHKSGPASNTPLTHWQTNLGSKYLLQNHICARCWHELSPLSGKQVWSSFSWGDPVCERSTQYKNVPFHPCNPLFFYMSSISIHIKWESSFFSFLIFKNKIEKLVPLVDLSKESVALDQICPDSTLIFYICRSYSKEMTVHF